MGLQGFLVARHAHGADLGAGNQAEHAVQHADAGAQNRYHGNFLAGDLLHLHRSGPALDLVVFQGQVVGRLVRQQGANLLGQLTEVLGADVGTAHQADLVADQRVTNFSDGHAGAPGG